MTTLYGTTFCKKLSKTTILNNKILKFWTRSYLEQQFAKKAAQEQQYATRKTYPKQQCPKRFSGITICKVCTTEIYYDIVTTNILKTIWDPMLVTKKCLFVTKNYHLLIWDPLLVTEKCSFVLKNYHFLSLCHEKWALSHSIRAESWRCEARC